MEPLATPAELATYSKGQIRADDPRAALLLGGASAAIRRYCRWHITPVITQTARLDGRGGPDLALKTLHLVDVVAISEHGRPFDPLTLEWSELGNIRHPGGCWTTRYRAITVTFEHGFEQADDVKQIVLQVVANALSSPMGITREQAGQVSISWSTTAPGVSGGISLLERDLALLDTYRLNKEA